MVHQANDVLLRLEPIIDCNTETEVWEKAIWVGQVAENDLLGIQQLALSGAEGFTSARILVWAANGEPRGFVDTALTDGHADITQVIARVAELPPVSVRAEDWPLPPISVVVCTKDRPDQLRDVLETLVHIDYPCFEVVVVDNNPAGGLVHPVVDELDQHAGPRVRVVAAPQPGLSMARNVGVEMAEYDLIAFTDDDVIVDDAWLRNIAHGFGRDERVVCVCGMVPSASLLTPAQVYFDRRVGWARRCDPAIYDLEYPPVSDPLFPMRVAKFGTGANFAMRKDALVAMGGFDEGLGVGSPTGGGEDIDIFLRTLLDKHLLVREPSAVVWHRHRTTVEELEVQVRNYGLGLGAWIAKLATRPQTLWMATRRIRPALRHLSTVTVVDQDDTVRDEPTLERLGRRELWGVLTGPVALMRARYSGRRGYPFIADAEARDWVYDTESESAGVPDSSRISPGILALSAVGLGAVGALAAIPGLPSLLASITLALFMFAGPGSLAMSWYTALPRYMVGSLVVAMSFAVVTLGVAGPLLIGYYQPRVILWCLALGIALGGMLRYAYLRYRTGSAPTA